jgi:hypothetical protein
MTHTRKTLAWVLAAAAALATAAPEAGAYTFPSLAGDPPVGTIATGATSCGSATGQVEQGSFGITSAQLCNPGGLTFIGPAIGQIASVIGPTIISPAVVGNAIVVSAGNGRAG